MILRRVILASSVLALCFMAISCIVMNRIYAEKDIVYGTNRFDLKYEVKDRDRRSPLFYFTQSIVKQINSENEVSFKAFDVLYLSSSSFKLEEKVILIIDDEVFPMNIENIELENVRNISEDKSNIMTSDSTTISVITGFSENNRKIARFSYEIPTIIMLKIREADQFILRYYSGPSIITVRPSKSSLNKVKQLIDIK